MGDNDGGGRKEKKKEVPEGLWGPAKQLNCCKQHHSPHVQTFKISAHVMGSARPLSGCTKRRCSFPNEVYRNVWLVQHQCCVPLSSRIVPPPTFESLFYICAHSIILAAFHAVAFYCWIKKANNINRVLRVSRGVDHKKKDNRTDSVQTPEIKTTNENIPLLPTSGKCYSR